MRQICLPQASYFPLERLTSREHRRVARFAGKKSYWIKSHLLCNINRYPRDLVSYFDKGNAGKKKHDDYTYLSSAFTLGVIMLNYKC